MEARPPPGGAYSFISCTIWPRPGPWRCACRGSRGGIAVSYAGLRAFRSGHHHFRAPGPSGPSGELAEQGGGGPRFNNTGLCADWRGDYAPGACRPNALLIPGPRGPEPGPARPPGPARRAMPLAGLAQWCPKRTPTVRLLVHAVKSTWTAPLGTADGNCFAMAD